jgi:hypothetical protein
MDDAGLAGLDDAQRYRPYKSPHSIDLNNPGNYNRLDDADDLDDPFACEGYPGSEHRSGHERKGRDAFKVCRFFPIPGTLHTHTRMAKRVCERFGNRCKTAKDLHHSVFTDLLAE